MNGNLSSPPATKKHNTTFGEAAFDVGVYGGVGYAANAGISLVVSHYAKNIQGSWLNKNYEASYQLINKTLHKVKRDEGDIARWAERTNDIAFLSSGGWALLIPMKWMEDYKAQIVGKIDHAFNTGPAYSADHPLNDDRPKQSYISLFGGRFVTYPIIIAVSLPIMTYLGGEKAIMSGLDKHAGNLFNRFQEPVALRKLAATELITAATGTALLYGSSRIIAYVDHLVEKGKKASPPTTDVQHSRHDGALHKEANKDISIAS